MKWAPSTVRSHLIQYLLRLDIEAPGMTHHSGLAMATQSVLVYAGYRAQGMAQVCYMLLIGPILDDRLKETFLKP